MTPTIIFAFSGLVILTLIGTKKLEEKRKKQLFTTIVISKGDAFIRERYHSITHFYIENKEKFFFYTNKQFPLYAKNWLNKFIAILKEKRGQYVVSMRNTKLLKKSDGISEFFKNMSSVEKGNGEINDYYKGGE